MEKDNENKLKEHMKTLIKDTKDDREIEKAEQIEIEKFLKEESVAKVYKKYNK